MNLDLRTYSTFAIGGIAHKVFEIRQIEDIRKILSYTDYTKKPFVIIGEGSNSIFADTTDKYIIGLMQIKGIIIQKQENSFLYIKAYAGERWDDVVNWSIEHNLSGLESLSGIPGTAGAAPIQNIGAYGSDISNTCIEVEVYDIEQKNIYSISKTDCKFGYRTSIFKNKKNKYIILSIILKLSTHPPQIPQYKEVENYFTENKNPSSKQIREVICGIRNKKIPNYKQIPNCGSFFENPIITKKHLQIIQKKFPNIPFFETKNSMYKLFTGWLIEHVDYKSTQTNSIIFNETNKLVLLNINNGRFDELQKVIQNITKLIYNTYQISLKIEPNIFM